MMMKQVCLILFFVFWFQFSRAQEYLDTVIHIPGVEIRAKTLFDKETAGLKETQIDSSLLVFKTGKSAGELLSENTSLYIFNYGRGALSTASFRGAAVSHTQVSWNGLAINSPMSGIVDLSLIPLFVVDKISLQHGASSIGYGSGGLGGHVDMTNAANWKTGVRGKYFQGIGSYRSFDEFAGIALGNSRVQSNTRIYHSFSANDYPYINTALYDRPRQRMDGGDYRKAGLLQEIYLRPSFRSSISGKVWYQDARRSIPLVMSYEGIDTSLSRQNTQYDRTLKAIVNGKLAVEKALITISSGVDYQELDYKMNIQISGLEEYTPVNSTSDMLNFANALTVDLNFSNRLGGKLKVGYNYYTITTYDSANITGFEAFRHEFTSYAALSANVTKWMNMSVRLRKDLISDLKTPLIYSLGISLKPMEARELVVKMLFARNFHHPSLNHLFWQPGGNPDLLSEEGYTGEAGVHYLLQRGSLKIGNQLSAYYSDIDNWILWLPSFKGYWEAVNIRRVQSYGLEFQSDMEWHIGKNAISMLANYLYSKSLNLGDPLIAGDDSYGMQLPFIPVHSGNVFISAERNGFYMNYQYEYCGIRHLLSSNRAGILDDSDYFGAESSNNPFFRLYAQHLNHLSFGKNIKVKKVSLSLELQIHNLFDEVYRNILNRYMPGRNYRILLKIDFPE